MLPFLTGVAVGAILASVIVPSIPYTVKVTPKIKAVSKFRKDPGLYDGSEASGELDNFLPLD